ncbi:MAG: HAMP domain-containing protein, partial [Actinomycetota bacterium]
MGFLSRYSLKIQIGIIVAMAALIMILATTVSWIARGKMEAADARTEAARLIFDETNRLDLALTDARRREKDFLARRDLGLVAKVGDDVHEAREALQTIRNHTAADDKDHLQLLDTVAEGIDKYGRTFDALVVLQKTIGLTPDEGLMGELRGAIHVLEREVEDAHDNRLEIMLLTARRGEKDYQLRTDLKYRDQVDTVVEEMLRAVHSGHTQSADRKRMAELLGAYQMAFTQVVQKTVAMGALQSALSRNYELVDEALAKLRGLAKADIAAMDAEMKAFDAIANRVESGLQIGGSIAVLVLGWLIARAIYGPLLAMTGVMEQMKAGRTDVEVPGTGRGDEVGRMAAAMEVFRDSMREAEALRRDQEAAKARAEQERRQGMHTMADRFETDVGKVVSGVGEAARSMEGAAQMLTAVAGQVLAQAGSVAAASEQAAANVQTVAAATEELSGSVVEIGRQVNHSTQIAKAAVAEASEADTIVRSLSEAANRIGEVVKLINDIA